MVLEELKSQFPRIRQNEPLKQHGMFRVGGPADFFYELHDIKEFPFLIQSANNHKIPFFVFGRGTNVLFLDKGFRGLVIKNLSNHISIEENEIKADSGVLLMEIIRKSVEAHLTGLEPLYGLPGTIGGAVFGNAGVPGAEIGNFTVDVTCFNFEESFHVHKKEELAFSYRSSRFKTEKKDTICAVRLSLQKGSKETSKEKIQIIDAIRRGKQPTGYTAGSFFKNPSVNQPAGMLIDQAGLKGFSIGGAEISLKHANFFMNKGNATAAQILKLAEIAEEKVFEKFGIRLEKEVQIIGQQ